MTGSLLQLTKQLWLEARLYVTNSIVARVPSHTLRLIYYRSIMKFTVGPGSAILMGTRFDAPGRLSIGSGSTINRGCRLDSRGGLSIGSNVSISSDVIILTASHDIQARDFTGIEKAVVIGDYVFIGTRAMILPGVTLGEGCVVAAGAVVSRDVAPYMIAAGIPARSVGTRNRDLDYKVTYRRLLQ